MIPQKSTLEKQTIDALTIKNNQAQAANSPKIFLHKLLQIVEMFDKDPSLQTVPQAINQEYLLDQKRVSELEKALEEKLNATYKALKEYRTNRQIPEPKLNEFEEACKPAHERKSYSTWPPIRTKIFSLEAQLKELAEESTKHYNFVSRHATISCPVHSKYNPYITVEVKLHPA